VSLCSIWVPHQKPVRIFGRMTAPTPRHLCGTAYNAALSSLRRKQSENFQQYFLERRLPRQRFANVPSLVVTNYPANVL
jgi:hypothetical protein